jgi:hypothetical protein
MKTVTPKVTNLNFNLSVGVVPLSSPYSKPARTPLTPSNCESALHVKSFQFTVVVPPLLDYIFLALVDQNGRDVRIRYKKVEECGLVSFQCSTVLSLLKLFRIYWISFNITFWEKQQLPQWEQLKSRKCTANLLDGNSLETSNLSSPLHVFDETSKSQFKRTSKCTVFDAVSISSLGKFPLFQTDLRQFATHCLLK